MGSISFLPARRAITPATLYISSPWRTSQKNTGGETPSLTPNSASLWWRWICYGILLQPYLHCSAARFVAIKSVPYSHLFELFETYDLNERKTVDIVFADSAIVVHFSINALPGKSLEEGLFFDKLAASFLSLFGSWLRHLTKFLTHIVEFAGQNAQLLALILMVAIFLCCILFLAGGDARPMTKR